jgi:hypothetical protein
MTLFRGQASWAKMTSPVAIVTSLACHPTKKVNKAEELTYLSTDIVLTQTIVVKIDLKEYIYIQPGACHLPA